MYAARSASVTRTSPPFTDPRAPARHPRRVVQQQRADKLRQLLAGPANQIRSLACAAALSGSWPYTPLPGSSERGGRAGIQLFLAANPSPQHIKGEQGSPLPAGEGAAPRPAGWRTDMEGSRPSGRLVEPAEATAGLLLESGQTMPEEEGMKSTTTLRTTWTTRRTTSWGAVRRSRQWRWN